MHLLKVHSIMVRNRSDMAIDIGTSLRMVHPFSSPACAAAFHFAGWWSISYEIAILPG